MNIAFRPGMTLDEFLDWEREQELRFEFDGHRAVAMNGGTLLHGRIAFRIARLIEDGVDGTGCIVVCGSVKVSVAGRIRYPDVVVTRPPASDTDIAPEPVVVVEVRSPSTANVDRFDKNDEYRQTPSIQHYVMLEQTRQAAMVFSRVGGEWVGGMVLPGALIELPAIGVVLALDAVYAGLGSLSA